MSNFFDAVEQVYQYIQVSAVTMLLDGRIYQHRFPTNGEVIGEGSENFICINNLESYKEQLTNTVPINIQVFCKELDYSLINQSWLSGMEKAIDAALEIKDGDKKVAYSNVQKVFSHILPENPYSKKYTLMVIRLNLTIDKL